MVVILKNTLFEKPLTNNGEHKLVETDLADSTIIIFFSENSEPVQ